MGQLTLPLFLLLVDSTRAANEPPEFSSLTFSNRLQVEMPLGCAGYLSGAGIPRFGSE